MTRRRSFLSQVQRDAYLISRAAGDAQAAKNGRLVKRVVRRKLVAALFRGLR